MSNKQVGRITPTSQRLVADDNLDDQDDDDLPLAVLAALGSDKNTDSPSKVDSPSKAHVPAQNIIPSSPQKLRKFTIFRKLPIELRLKIWKHACFHGRNISLWSLPVESSITIAGEEAIMKPFKWISHHRIPALLHASSESRDVGLQHYSLAFDSRVKKEESEVIGGVELTLTIPPRIYVNFDVDVICPFHLEGGRAGEIYKDLATKPVKIIALSYNNMKWLLEGMISHSRHPTLKEAWLYPSEHPGDIEFDRDQPFKIRINANKSTDSDKGYQIGENALTVKFKIMELDWLSFCDEQGRR